MCKGNQKTGSGIEKACRGQKNNTTQTLKNRKQSVMREKQTITTKKTNQKII